MEPCSEHSGFVVELKNHSESLSENKSQLQRVHQRIDDLANGQNQLRDDLLEKMDRTSEQVQNSYESAMSVFTDKESGIILGRDGLKSQFDVYKQQFDEVKHNVQMTFKILKWAGLVMFGILGVHYAPIGKIFGVFFGG